ncbi:hypothetical protein D7V88_00190 [Corallococcus terminator]|uniref:Uncharacterized protein n=1 Tax=Corallococcus terminator TaxID=2316733 RepID=A0A3A8JUX6_9BACT|nr:hypothetical protein D7V88_00190 [Corallococcus terminator]
MAAAHPSRQIEGFGDDALLQAIEWESVPLRIDHPLKHSEGRGLEIVNSFSDVLWATQHALQVDAHRRAALCFTHLKMVVGESIERVLVQACEEFLKPHRCSLTCFLRVP